MDGDDDRRSECGRSPYGIRLELETRAACRPVAVVAHVKRLAMSGGPGRAGVFAEGLDGVAELGDDAVRIGRKGRDLEIREVAPPGLETAQAADEAEFPRFPDPR